jgi:hypothetical protein
MYPCTHHIGGSSTGYEIPALLAHVTKTSVLIPSLKAAFSRLYDRDRARATTALFSWRFSAIRCPSRASDAVSLRLSSSLNPSARGDLPEVPP